MGGIVARECGLRNAECGISGGASIRGSTFHLHSAFRTPHSALLMSVQAIAWSPSGAVRIIDQRALPEARIERDLESAEAVADAIRTLQVRGAPLIGIAAAMGLVAATRGRSEEHTSELQSQSNLVCRLLLEKKKFKADFSGD